MNEILQRITLLIIVVVTVFFSGCIAEEQLIENKNKDIQENSKIEEKIIPENSDIEVKTNTEEEYVPKYNTSKFLTPPTNLALPLDLEDIGTGSKFFSPFGIIRKKRR